MTTKSGTHAIPAKKKPTRPVTKAKAGAAKRTARAGQKTGARGLAQARSTKTNQYIELLTRRNGATIEELMAATGWQAHSVRGFLSGTIKKKLGHKLDSAVAATGARRYRIVQLDEVG